VSGQRLATICKLTELAAEGLTRDEAAAELGLSYSTVVQYAIANGIGFSRKRKAHVPTQRTRDMAALYQSGQTLQEIGSQFGVTRERVRQLITKFHGLRAADGGQRVTATLARAARLNKIEARHQQKYGCSRAQYRMLKKTRATRAFTELNRNSHRDGYAVDLTLWQWWTLWQESGHWDDRGRGHGYWLFRPRSDAPLSIDNYCIAPGSEAIRLMKQLEPSRFPSRGSRIPSAQPELAAMGVQANLRGGEHPPARHRATTPRELPSGSILPLESPLERNGVTSSAARYRRAGFHCVLPVRPCRCCPAQRVRPYCPEQVNTASRWLLAQLTRQS
jgi:DNA-binding CsgD family transcriptional regulator